MDLVGHGFCVELDVFKGENKTEVLYIYICVCVCLNQLRTIHNPNLSNKIILKPPRMLLFPFMCRQVYAVSAIAGLGVGRRTCINPYYYCVIAVPSGPCIL